MDDTWLYLLFLAYLYSINSLRQFLSFWCNSLESSQSVENTLRKNVPFYTVFPLPLLFAEAGNLSTLSAALTPRMEILPRLRHILTLHS